jgi:hypothetical protein
MNNFKSNRTIFLFLLLVFYGFLYYSYIVLPENVAIHFSIDGEPNGWMSKIRYLVSFGLIGTVTPSFVIVLFYKIKFSDNNIVNIPNKEYWLSPERFQQTVSKLRNFGILFANVILFIFIGVEILIFDANKKIIIHSLPIKYGIVPLLLPVIFILWKFYRIFRITPIQKSL